MPRRLSRQTIFLLLVTGALVLLGTLNLHSRLKRPQIPYDGVTWADSPQGVVAAIVDPQGPAARAGVRRGDRLVGISVSGGSPFDAVARASDVQIYLEAAGVGAPISYLIERANVYGDRSTWVADIAELAAKPQKLGRGLYLAAIGVVYLVIGLYVLLRQGRAPYVRHFYLICLMAFVVHFYSFTETLDRLDWIIFLADNAALLLLAPLFLHFAALFPLRRQIVRQRRVVTVAIYVPAMILLALEIALAAGWRPRTESVLRVRAHLDAAALIQFIGCFLAGGGLLVRTFLKAETPLLRQQMKWIVWGLGVSILPFTAYELYTYFVTPNVSPVVEALAIGPLIFIPLSFGYSIVRYRLMDVDVIVRRSFVHFLATASVAALYAILLGKGATLITELVPNAPPWFIQAVTVGGVLAIAMLFAPIKNWLMERMDRLFYGERYSARRSLDAFIRTISATTDLDALLERTAERLQRIFSVEKIAIFIEDARTPVGYRLAFSRGVSAADLKLPLDFGRIVLAESGRTGVLAREVTPWLPETFARGVDDLQYFVPCLTHDRPIAILALGRPVEAPLLTSEDVGLLRVISGYLAIAIENSLLYGEQARRAAELAQLKEFNESVIESINVGIIALTPEGRVTMWNSAAEALVGIPRPQALDRSIEELLDADLIRALRDVTHPHGWAVPEVRNIYKFRWRAGEDRDLVLNVSLVPLWMRSGGPSGSLLVLEDLTHRVRLEEQLQQREKLSSLGLLAAGVAHEVNTPLAGISSYTQMLLKQFPPTDPRRALLEKIETQVLRASQIVQSLLNFARMERPMVSELDIRRVLDDTLQLLEPQLRDTRIEVVRRYAEALPPVLGDATKLQQVFMNLILNARDAMPEGGRLTLAAYLSDDQVCVDVEDTGVGIPPEHIARIYDPFFTTKGVGRGTGLGLALSYGIIQEHAGRIFVESQVGRGTRFTIALPALDARRASGALGETPERAMAAGD
ncbi:Sensor kinase CckA [bacterium HR08]|nr:Sensor kinase CckA [bacterium HR08]